MSGWVMLGCFLALMGSFAIAIHWNRQIDQKEDKERQVQRGEEPGRHD